MCDTFVHIPAQNDQPVIFGKNSDREPNEAQQIVCYPATKRANAKVRTTFIEIDHPNETQEVMLSKPFQVWGAEMGCNASGVVIGNEAVFTKIPFQKKNTGLTGMDMIRLCLEISSSAMDALEQLVFYIEKYGQDACGGYTDKNFYYHNSFIIADKNEAYVLETAGEHWVYQKVKGYRAISNGLSIEEAYDGISANAISFAIKKGWISSKEDFNFKKAYSAWLMPKLAACAVRRKSSEQLGRSFNDFSIADAFQILRSHGDENYDPANGGTDSICMHASGLLTPHQTVGSMAVELNKDDPPAVWLTGTAAPCTSIFKPFYFGDDILNEANFLPPSSTYDDAYWWQWEKLHRDALKNYPEKIKLIQKERDDVESSFIEQHKKLVKNPDSHKAKELSRRALNQSIALRDKWLEEIQHVATKKHFLYDLFWNRQNEKVNFYQKNTIQ